jgi:hypothetical protein
MMIFDHKNPTHVRILKEELSRAKRIINESTYNADTVWDKMTEVERNEALYVAKVTNSDELIESTWDEIPADTQDIIDLSDYELANTDKGGRTNIRGLEYGLTQHPEAKTFVNKFLKKVGRASLKDITIKQSYILQPAFWTYVNSQKPQQQIQRNTQNDIQSGRTEPSRDPFYKGGASWTGD